MSSREALRRGTRKLGWLLAALGLMLLVQAQVLWLNQG